MIPPAPVTLRDVTAAHGRRVAVEAVSATLAPGSLTAVMGPNGAGKTTLLRVIAGLHRPASGQVDRGGMAPAERRESAEVIARNARMLLKHVNDLLDMSKLEARKLKIELQDADVAALVRFLAAPASGWRSPRNSSSCTRAPSKSWIPTWAARSSG